MSEETPKPKSFRFRPHEHLRRKKEFDRVYARKRSVSDSWLIVYACENDLSHTRIGLSVAKKVFALATQRNRVRRLYREAFRLTRHEMPTGIDLVLIPRRSEIPSLETLTNILPRLVRAVAKKLSPTPDAPQPTESPS
jgi:ribonuclease P protein component